MRPTVRRGSAGTRKRGTGCRDRLGLPGVVLLVLLPAAVGAQTPAMVSWEYYDEPCGEAQPTLTVPCGRFGEFHFGVTASSCQPEDGGVEEPTLYPIEVPLAPVPQEPVPPPPAPPASGEPWTAIIDWQGTHGAMVGALVDTLSGPDIPVVPFHLDDPALSPLGSSVGDQHLLAALCQVADAIDDGGPHGLQTLSLSLGRLPVATDPQDGEPCGSRLSCEVRNVMRYLRTRGVTLAAAAGNHQQLLFPANLAETIAVGQIDISAYLATLVEKKSWESPGPIDAYMPGHGLCVLGTTAPSGSSLSTAFFAGSLARLATERSGVDAYAGSPWTLRWSGQQGCLVLAQGEIEHDYCNPAMVPVVAGIVLGSQAGCWDLPDPSKVVYAPPPGTAGALPQSPSLAAASSGILSPAPEESPCIPCVGGPSSSSFAWSNDLVLNLTRSVPLSPSLYLDSLSLRSGDSLYRIDLPQAQLDQFAAAELDALVLVGFGELLDEVEHPSLLYLLKTDPDLDCSTGAGSCFWSSTYVLPLP